jgi:hypothetical protein
MKTLKGAVWFIVLGGSWLGSQGCMFVHDTECETDRDCDSGRVCSSGTCKGGTSESNGARCDTSRSGWCSCYSGPGADNWWNSSAAVSSCSGYPCCYTYTRDSSVGTRGCSCTNDYSGLNCSSSIHSTVPSAVIVSSCPNGTTGTPPSSGG